MARAKIDDSVVRATVGVGTGRKLSARDLMSEAERILHKTGSGQSLYEHCLHD